MGWGAPRPSWPPAAPGHSAVVARSRGEIPPPPPRLRFPPLRAGPGGEVSGEQKATAGSPGVPRPSAPAAGGGRTPFSSPACPPPPPLPPSSSSGRDTRNPPGRGEEAAARSGRGGGGCTATRPSVCVSVRPSARPAMAAPRNLLLLVLLLLLPPPPGGEPLGWGRSSRPGTGSATFAPAPEDPGVSNPPGLTSLPPQHPSPPEATSSRPQAAVPPWLCPGIEGWGWESTVPLMFLGIGSAVGWVG